MSGEQSHSEKTGGGGGRVMPHKKIFDFLYCSTAEVGPDLQLQELWFPKEIVQVTTGDIFTLLCM